MRVLLFVLDVNMRRKCEAAKVIAMLVWGRGGVFEVSAGYAYVGGTHGSGIVSCAADVLGMSVVRGMKGVVVVCMKCVCVWLGRCMS